MTVHRLHDYKAAREVLVLDKLAVLRNGIVGQPSSGNELRAFYEQICAEHERWVRNCYLVCLCLVLASAIVSTAVIAVVVHLSIGAALIVGAVTSIFGLTIYHCAILGKD